MTPLVRRKKDHLELCITKSVEHSTKNTGLEEVYLVPKALPEFDFEELDLSVDFLGRKFSSPLFITGMTGGPFETEKINFTLAEMAESESIVMGLGSQRVALRNKKLQKSFQLKKKFPKLFLVGNLGFAQLVDDDALSLCAQAVDMVEADALAIHLNLLQELVQEDGDRIFKKFLLQLENICQNLRVPVIIKDVGCGLDLKSFYQIRAAGVAAVDIGGSGGTSWSLIEGLRARSKVYQSVGKTFQDWGIPTAYAMKNIHDFDASMTVTATGGVRDGLQVAKLLGLGARLVGVGLPFLKAAVGGKKPTQEIYQTFIHELKVAMICAGAQNVKQLAQRVRVSEHFQNSLKLFV